MTERVQLNYNLDLNSKPNPVTTLKESKETFRSALSSRHFQKQDD